MAWIRSAGWGNLAGAFVLDRAREWRPLLRFHKADSLVVAAVPLS